MLAVANAPVLQANVTFKISRSKVQYSFLPILVLAILAKLIFIPEGNSAV